MFGEEQRFQNYSTLLTLNLIRSSRIDSSRENRRVRIGDERGWAVCFQILGDGM